MRQYWPVDPFLFLAALNAGVNLTKFAAGLRKNSQAILMGVSDDVRALVEEHYRVALVELDAAGATSSDEEREQHIARASDHLRHAQSNPRLSPVVKAECAAVLAVLAARKGTVRLTV